MGQKLLRVASGTTRGKFGAYLKGHYQLYLFLVPAIIYLILFQYLPIYGVQIAFREYTPQLGITGSPFVGLKQFEDFFTSYFFGTTLGNTLILSGLTLLVGFPVPILLALTLNQLPGKHYRKLIQTVTYAPYFISMVVICGMIYIFLSPRTGLVNNFLSLIGMESINFMGDPKYFRAIYVLSDVWQMAGWNAIIYLASLASVSPELHEAAVVDGANKFQRIWYIDIPGILPTAMILLILNMGNIMSVGFEKAFLLQTSSNTKVSEIIATYVYKIGIEQTRYSYAAAVGLFNSLVNMILLVFVNAISKRLTDQSLW